MKPTTAAPFETDAEFEKRLDEHLAKESYDADAHRAEVAKNVPTRKPRTHPAKRVARAEKIAKVLADVPHKSNEYTGFSVSYYQLPISHPTTPGRDPYIVECNDIIEALGMSYAEGNVFKALWRKCAARQGMSKRGYADGKYDAEKMVYFSQRVLDDEVTPKGKKE